MKNTLALAFVLVAVAACSSEEADDAVFAEQETSANGTGADTPPLTNGKAAPQQETACTVGATKKCFVGDATNAGMGDCTFGTQTCVNLPGSGEFTATGWGPCEGYGTGDACNPPASPAPRKVNLNVDGDCVCAPACPADVPFIVGCKIDFQGSNTNGCVAPAKDGRIYFQEGVKCDSGHLTGYVLCSSVAGGALDQNNCPINKSDPHFGSKPSTCPKIESGTPDGCYF